MPLNPRPADPRPTIEDEVKTPVEARQGHRDKPILTLLIVSLVLAVLAGLISWMVY